jgi:Dyp-type peroxidase family
VAVAKLDLDQIQGNIIPGFLSDFQQLLFVRFPSGAAGRRWLGELTFEVNSAREIATFMVLRQLIRHPRELKTTHSRIASENRPARVVSRVVRTNWINVALSARGLRIVREGRRAKDQAFPAWFTQGMFARDGSTGDDRDQMSTWMVRDGAEDGHEEDPRVAHAVLMLGADTAADLDREINRQQSRLYALGLTNVASYRGETLGNGQEHFGFRDGISQPVIDLSELIPGWEKPAGPVRPGEFILGQLDEARHSVIDGPTWAENGSYLVFRRLSQHVGRAREQVHEQYVRLRAELWAKVGAKADQQISESLLAAKLVGRWPSGAKLVKDKQELIDPYNPHTGHRPPPDRLVIDQADFESDPTGEVCPLFSHVRRSHPRSLPDDNPNRHRLLRRAIPYGPPLPPGAPEDNVGRGLLFMAFQADIERQFETIQGQWMNSEMPPELTSAESEPIGADAVLGVLGSNSDREVPVFYQPPDGLDRVPLSFRRFVTVEGGGYFFAPSIGALGLLSR